MTLASPTQVVAFVGPKGGGGKTTLAVMMADLLAQLKQPYLLVDLDFTTHGAAHFFRHRMKEKVGARGLWQIVKAFPRGSDEDSVSDIDAEDISFQIESAVIPLSERDPKTDESSSEGGHGEDRPFGGVVTSIADTPEPEDPESLLQGYTADDLHRRFLAPLITWCRDNEVRYVLLDCPAGLSLMSHAAVKAIGEDGLAIFVLEDDLISRDAYNTLLDKLGFYSSEPKENAGKTPFCYVFNKVEYGGLKTPPPLRGTALPPLPYDPDVRGTYGYADIPQSSLFRRSLVEVLRSALAGGAQGESTTLKAAIGEYVNRLEPAVNNELEVDQREAAERLKAAERLEAEERELRERRAGNARFWRIWRALFAVVVLLLFAASWWSGYSQTLSYEKRQLLLFALPVIGFAFACVMLLVSAFFASADPETDKRQHEQVRGELDRMQERAREDQKRRRENAAFVRDHAAAGKA